MKKTNKTDIEAAALAATEQISAAAKSATLVISDAALSATKLLAVQTSEAAKVANVKINDDHDLLVELKVKMEDLKNDISELKDGTSNKIASHEIRLVALETTNTRLNVMLAIGTGLLTIIWGLVVYHLFQK